MDEQRNKNTTSSAAETIERIDTNVAELKAFLMAVKPKKELALPENGNRSGNIFEPGFSQDAMDQG